MEVNINLHKRRQRQQQMEPISQSNINVLDRLKERFHRGLDGTSIAIIQLLLFWVNSLVRWLVDFAVNNVDFGFVFFKCRTQANAFIIVFR